MHIDWFILLCENSDVLTGTEVERTGRVIDIPVGRELLGRIINPLGVPQDDRGPLTTTSRLPIERPSPHIMDRAPVTEPLQTGIKVIDTLVPIGRGQRQLILGDRQTGKTAIALDTVANQYDKGVICIYCAIGQRTSSVAGAIESLRKRGAMKYTVTVVTEGNDPPGLRYLAPYAATAIIETEAENHSDYIPTNLISITDGQLYLSPRLFELGQLPAIDIAQSSWHSLSPSNHKNQPLKVPRRPKLSKPCPMAFSSSEPIKAWSDNSTKAWRIRSSPRFRRPGIPPSSGPSENASR